MTQLLQFLIYGLLEKLFIELKLLVDLTAEISLFFEQSLSYSIHSFFDFAFETLFIVFDFGVFDHLDELLPQILFFPQDIRVNQGHLVPKVLRVSSHIVPAYKVMAFMAPKYATLVTYPQRTIVAKHFQSLQVNRTLLIRVIGLSQFLVLKFVDVLDWRLRLKELCVLGRVLVGGVGGFVVKRNRGEICYELKKVLVFREMLNRGIFGTNFNLV